jgi:hypothetical protein
MSMIVGTWEFGTADYAVRAATVLSTRVRGVRLSRRGDSKPVSGPFRVLPPVRF